MASASKQLAAEMRWLLRVEELILTKRSNSRPSESWIQIARKVEGVLKKPSMSKFLAILDQHNTELIAQNRYNHERRNSFFLLGPQLFHVFHSVKARSAMLSKMPALNRPLRRSALIWKRFRLSARIWPVCCGKGRSQQSR